MDAAFAQINPYNGRLRNCFAQNKMKIVSELKQLFSGKNTGKKNQTVWLQSINLLNVRKSEHITRGRGERC